MGRIFAGSASGAAKRPGQSQPRRVGDLHGADALRAPPARPEQQRFNALATASSAEELAHHLRGIIQLLRREGIPLDYAQLAEDLYWMQFSATAPRVRLRWAEDYYHMPSEDNENTNTDSGKELQDE